MSTFRQRTATGVAEARPATRVRSVKTSRRIGFVLKLLAVILATLYALAPVLLILSAALNPANTLVDQSLIPEGATLDNFRSLFNSPQHPWPIWIWNSVKLAGLTAFIVVAVSALGAYAISRFRYRGRQAGLLTIILIQLFPNILTVVALFLLLQQIGKVFPFLGLNTHGGLLLIYTGGALGFNTYLMKGYFDTVPRELDESARMDGASNFQTFWHVMLPLVRPILAVIAILTFVATYGDFLLARVMLKSTDQYTLAVGMALFINDQFNQRWGIFAAAALVGALPIVIVFLTLQRQLIGGLTSGSVKG